ncbi:MAG: PRC-barrel domain protein [Hyphomicrobiales bacterium]|nr:PRC-barrel domain protein [Hyphomicrobiales bacterium]
MTKRLDASRLVLAASVIAVSAINAAAQAPDAATANPPAQAPAQSIEQPAPKKPTGTFVNVRRPDQWSATGLKAKNIYDPADNKIGAINDLVIDRDGRVAAVVIGVGGFLGIGEKNVGVPFSDVKISMRDGNEWLVLDRSKDDLKAAPGFSLASGSPAPQQASGTPDRNFGTLDVSGAATNGQKPAQADADANAASK